jgi:hypothetical protein
MVVVKKMEGKRKKGRNADVNENDAENEPDGKNDDETEDEDEKSKKDDEVDDESDDEDDDESDDEDDDDDDNDGEIRIKMIFDVKGLEELKILHGRFLTIPVSKRRRHQGFFLLLGEEIRNYLAQSERTKEAYHTLRKKGEYLLFRPELQHPCAVKRRAFNFDESGLARLSKIGNLFSGTSGTDEPDLII